MPNYCFCVPILPGGIERMKAWVKEEIRGAGAKGHDEVFAAAGVSREQVWVQHTPMGDFAVVSFETADPAKAMASFGASKHAWAVKFRAFAKAVHGVDFANPPPPNDKVADWTA